MKILFVWTGITSYMTDCWRTLSARPDADLKVIVERHPSDRGFDAEKAMAGLDGVLTEAGEDATRPFLAEGRWAHWRPEVIFAVGWHSPTVRTLIQWPTFGATPKVCCYDLPWDGSPRRILARWALRGFLRHYAAAYVPGAACERYANWLRFGKVYKGLFSIDAERFASAAGDRSRPRRGFLYVGRLAPEKRIDLLLRGYALYRKNGGTWPLDLYGRGEKPEELAAESQARFHPFVQPEAVPRLYAEHGCFVLASDFDPWPLVLLQACASNLPIVASDRCTNHFELLKDNGLLFRHGDVRALAEALLRVEREGVDASSGASLAAPYDKRVWADRTMRICKELTTP